jgi:hypothetical protein
MSGWLSVPHAWTKADAHKPEVEFDGDVLRVIGYTFHANGVQQVDSKFPVAEFMRSCAHDPELRVIMLQALADEARSAHDGVKPDWLYPRQPAKRVTA